MIIKGLADSPLFHQIEKKEQLIKVKSDNNWVNKHALISDVIYEALLEVGTEATTYRLSPKEKRSLAKIQYHFKICDKKISENAIIRIALNYVFFDYKNNKQKSIVSLLLEKKKV